MHDQKKKLLTKVTSKANNSLEIREKGFFFPIICQIAFIFFRKHKWVC